MSSMSSNNSNISVNINQHNSNNHNISNQGHALGSSVWAASRRFQMLTACDWAEEKLAEGGRLLFTTDSVGCCVRIDSMMGLSHERLLSSLEHTKGEYDAVCAFRPTGWTFSKTWRKFRPWTENEGRTKIFSIPYSEHSSFSELRELVNTLRPRKIIPTVNIERTQVASSKRSGPNPNDDSLVRNQCCRCRMEPLTCRCFHPY